MTDINAVLTHIESNVGIIEIARPDKFNCLSIHVLQGIEQALDQFEKPSLDIRAILIRSQGQHFCTGADLEQVKSLLTNPQELSDFIKFGHSVFARLENSKFPIVAACQGLTLAGGCELMLACDVVFACEGSRFGDQHAQFGLIPGWGGTQRLTRVLGLRRALDLFYSARWIDAQTALHWGLVNYVVPEDQLHLEALSYCLKMANRSQLGLVTMKSLARTGQDLTLNEGLELEANLAPEILMGYDVNEGISAFVERRKPKFNLR